MRHLLTLADLTAAEIERILAIADGLKQRYEQGLREPLLAGRVMALLFEKPSLRTRVSFEAGMVHLGGSSIFLGADTGLGSRETIPDFARTLDKFADIIVIRANRHQSAVELAAHSACPVINGLTDFGHPCQALADFFTVRERLGKLSGQTIAWVGDANNVARSLAVGCGKLGVRMVMATPEAYQFDEPSLAWIRQHSPNVDLSVTTDPVEAVRHATVIYTDVWASMGQESEQATRCRDFAAYQVNSALMRHASRDAVFMHCLPAHRGEEVTDEVIEGPQSIVFQQAANRMHAQKGIVAWLLGVKA
ncbi:MAG: ornithine carbamoyltransferase [Planctomycetaceae bacterium]|nr:ornithine carbamoyltransferase [Planctomycetaceae bacterium]